MPWRHERRCGRQCRRVLIGIVCFSHEGARPSYTTLIWDALRLSVKGSIPALAIQEQVSLFGAKAHNLAKIKGNVRRDPFGDFIFRLSEAEGALLTASVPAKKFEPGCIAALDADQLETFVDDWGSDMEDAAVEAAITTLSHWPVSKARNFIAISGAEKQCLDAIKHFSIKDLEGVEDIEITFTERFADGLRIEFYFEMRTLIWTIAVLTTDYQADPDVFAAHFHNMVIDSEHTTMGLAQRSYLKARMVFDQKSETFGEVALLTSAACLPRRPRARHALTT